MKLALPNLPKWPKRPPTPDTEREYYAKTGFIDKVTERIRMRTIRKMRIQVEFYLYNERGIPYYKRYDKWTEKRPEELYREGFQDSVRTPGYDHIAWWGVPIYVRIFGGEVFNIRAKDENGNLLYSQDTPNTLDDDLKSNAVKDFVKGLYKTVTTTMDLQKIAFMGIIAVGAVFGLMMMGVI